MYFTGHICLPQDLPSPEKSTACMVQNIGAESSHDLWLCKGTTDGQSVAAQVKELRDAGAEKIFRETASGAKSDRAELRSALAVLDADDVLLVTRLDRLVRSTRDLLNTLYPSGVGRG